MREHLDSDSENVRELQSNTRDNDIDTFHRVQKCIFNLAFTSQVFETVSTEDYYTKYFFKYS